MNLIKKNELFLLEELVKRNFSSKYKDSVLGIFWSVLRPLLMVALLTVVFSTMFNRSIANYPVYLLTGRTIFRYFTATIGLSMNAIKGNKNILQKIDAPKHIFVLAAVISEFLNFIISALLLIPVMLVTHAEFYFNTIPFAIIPVIALIILVTGVSLLLSILCVYYTDIQHLWGVVSQMIMYASALFYPMELIPEPYHSFLLLNPLFINLGIM